MILFLLDELEGVLFGSGSPVLLKLIGGSLQFLFLFEPLVVEDFDHLILYNLAFMDRFLGILELLELLFRLVEQITLAFQETFNVLRIRPLLPVFLLRF